MTKWSDQLKKRATAAHGNRHALDEYRAGAIRCEQCAKKMRNQADREWQTCLARAYRMLAEAEAASHHPRTQSQT
jgi:hypothetical protein